MNCALDVDGDGGGMADLFGRFARALLEGPRAWAAPQELAAALGWTEEDLDRIALELEAAGLVDRWNDCLTLSPLGASRLGLHLVADDVLELYRWSTVSASARSRRPGQRAREHTERYDRRLGRFVDPRALAPDQIAMRAERATSRRWHSRDLCPKPAIILWGHGLLPWEEFRRSPRPELRCRSCRIPPLGRKQVLAALCACGLGHRPRPNLQFCPGCHGRPLRPSMYCLRCDRWGLDGYFARRQVRGPARRRRRYARAG
jgi:hypothetical protein